MPRLALVVTAVLLSLLLGSCTRTFRVTAVFVDRTITFLSEDDEPTDSPWCWDRFKISDDSGEPVWEFEVPPSSYRDGESCGPNFPLTFGRLPARAQLVVPPRQLERGRLYVISGTAGGMLEGAFTLRESNGRVTLENIEPSSEHARRALERNNAWVRSRDAVPASPAGGRPTVAEPFMVPEDAEAGAAGADRYTWLLNTGPSDHFPSLSYASLDGREILFDLWCRYRGAVIYIRMSDARLAGAGFTLKSGRFQSSDRLSGPGDPDTPFRVGALLPENSPVLRNFGLTGRLVMHLPNRQLALDATGEAERNNVRSFFEQCYYARETEPSLPW